MNWTKARASTDSVTTALPARVRAWFERVRAEASELHRSLLTCQPFNRSSGSRYTSSLESVLLCRPWACA
jgi:hypothetical protein